MVKLEKHQKVFGIGLSRTGTTSLGEALNMLGIKTIHYPSDRVTINELKKGHYKLSILKTYQGALDTPVAPYYAQFDKHYPGSKFILTIREMSSWLRSLENFWRLWLENDPDRKSSDFISASVYGTLEFNEDRFRYVYETHYRNVCEYFVHRPDDLLVMSVLNGDGWEKLCPFLGLAIPQEPFPHLNTLHEREEEWRNQRQARQQWRQQLDLTKQDISRLIGPGDAFILVDRAELGDEIAPGRHVLPFLERDGQYWGPPPDDDTAIRELGRLRGSGANFIVFCWPAFWWLDYYLGFHGYLSAHFRCVLENERLIIFDLRS